MVLQLWGNDDGILFDDTGIIVCDECPCTTCDALCTAEHATIALTFNMVAENIRTPSDPDYPCEGECLDYNTTAFFLAKDGDTVQTPTLTCIDTWLCDGLCGHKIIYKVSRDSIGNQSRVLQVWRSTVDASPMMGHYSYSTSGTPMDCSTPENAPFDSSDTDADDCNFSLSEAFLFPL